MSELNRTPEEWAEYGTHKDGSLVDAFEMAIEQGKRQEKEHFKTATNVRKINAWWIDMRGKGDNIFEGRCDLDDSVKDGESIIIVAEQWQIPCTVKNNDDATVSFETVL